MKFNLSGICVVALFFISSLCQSAQLAPPNIKPIDRYGVNVASGQVTTVIPTVSIGGSMGLSHQLASHSSKFISNFGSAEIALSDSFAATAHYEQIAEKFTYKHIYYNVFNVMRVFDGSGSVDFVVMVNGSVSSYIPANCGSGCPQNYTYEVMSDPPSFPGDSRNSLVVNGNYLDWTKPDGTVVQFYRGASANPTTIGYLSKITYPNGFEVNVARRSLADPAVTSVTTNTGFQIFYVYHDDRRTMDSSKTPPSNFVVSQASADSLNWSSYNPNYIYAINNAVEFCNPKPGLSDTFSSFRSNLSTCNNNWPYVELSWPAGMPRAFLIGDSVFTVKNSVNQTAEYNIRAFDTAVTYTNGGQFVGNPGEYFVPRIIGVKKFGQSSSAVNYSYKTILQATSGCGDSWVCTWVEVDGGQVNTASGILGTNGYSFNGKASQNPYDMINYGSYINVYKMGQNALGSIYKVVTPDATSEYEIGARNVLTRYSPNDGPVQSFYYETRDNLTRIVKNEGGANQATQTAEYPASCTNQKTCNQATSITDYKGYQTDYTYHQASGQIETETFPANKSGVRAQNRYEYTALSAHYYTATGLVTGSPIYLKTAEMYCANSSYIGAGDGNSHFNGHCATSNDEVTTRYEYDDKNLLLKGVTVTAANDAGTVVTKRTCYQYDIYGNRIGETSPNAKLSSCN